MNSALLFVRLILASLILYGCGFSSFPTKSDVDAFFESIEKGSRGQQNYRQGKAFLLSIRAPDRVEEDRIAGDALDRLALYYLKTKDEGILQAVDETKIDGGFANMVCSFYSTIIKTEEAKTNYYHGRCMALSRCTGLSFSEEEIAKLCREKP